MRNNYIYMASLNLIRRRKTVMFNIMLISASLLIILFTSTSAESVDNFLYKYLYNTLNFRTLRIDTFKLQQDRYDVIKSVVDSDDRIIDFYDEIFGAIVEMGNPEIIDNIEKYNQEPFFGTIRLKNYTKTYKDYLLAGDLIKETDSNVGIIPKMFYPCGSFDAGYWRSNNEFIDGEELIGKTIHVKYFARNYASDKMEIIKTFTYSFEVIGVYDILQNQNLPYDIFVPHKDLQTILNNIESTNQGLTEDFNKSYSIVVDEAENVNEVNQRLLKAGLLGVPMAEAGPFFDISRHVIRSGYILGAIILLIGMINIALTMAKDIEKRGGEIGLLKAMGYQNKHLILILSMEAIIIGVISIIIAIIIYVSVVTGVGLWIQKNLSLYMQQLQLKIDFLILMKYTILGIVIPLISCLLGMFTLRHITPKEALLKGGGNH